MIDQGWYYHCPPNFMPSHATCQSSLNSGVIVIQSQPCQPCFTTVPLSLLKIIIANFIGYIIMLIAMC